MTTMVSARALWHPADKSSWPAQMFSCTIDGWDYISDRFMLLPVARLGELPVGYDELLVPLPPQAEAQFAEWMNATVIPAPSNRMFDRAIIDPLEAAGFLLRPLVGVKNAHGICEDLDLALVGLAIPVHAAVTSGESCRKAGA